MVKPAQPKGIKPKAEISSETYTPASGSSELSGNKLIIINTVITVLICLLFIGGNYFTVNSIVDSKIQNLPSQNTREIAEESSEKPERGIILDLGEFILNLSDPGSKRFLKLNVALEVSVSPEDLEHSSAESDGHGGGHGGGHGEEDDPVNKIEAEMNQYRPAIRDAVISVMSSKTAEELMSLAGKELAKEHIKEAIDPLFGGEREVMRVSFGAFIIQ